MSQLLLMPPRLSGMDADAQALIAGVAAAGDTVPAGWGSAWNKFVQAAKAHGYWSNFGLLAPMLGSHLAGALVAYNDGAIVNLTNVNFVESDYVSTSGLTGDGATKYIQTARMDTDSNLSDMSIGFNRLGTVLTGPSQVAMGTLVNADQVLFLRAETFTSGDNGVGIGSVGGGIVAVSNGLCLASRNGALVNFYQNTTVAFSGNEGGVLPGLAISLFGCNISGSGTGAFAQCTFNLFFVGTSFTEGQVNSFQSDYSVFLAAVGRPALP